MFSHRRPARLAAKVPPKAPRFEPYATEYMPAFTMRSLLWERACRKAGFCITLVRRMVDPMFVPPKLHKIMLRTAIKKTVVSTP